MIVLSYLGGKVTVMPTPLVRCPDVNRVWLDDLTIADFSVPETAEEATARAVRFKHAINSEALRALAGQQLSGGLDVHYADVLLDDSAQLVYGFYQHPSHEDLFEILGLRLDPGSGSLYVQNTRPRISGAAADAVGDLLATPYGAALGEELDATLQELVEARFWLEKLARHLEDPASVAGEPDPAEEVRYGCCKAAVLVLTEPASDLRVVANAIVETWTASPAELLAATEDLLRPPG